MGEAVQFPDRVGDVVVVGVEQVGAAGCVAGKVHLNNAMVRQVADIFDGIEIVIHTGDMDVVDVEQQAAIGFVGDAGQEFPFRHCGGGESDVTAGIFQDKRPLQIIL